MTRTNRIGAVLMALVLVGSVLAGPVGIAAAQSSVSITQAAQGSTTVAPGETVTVDVSVSTVESGATAIELEGVPSGWDVQATDSDGGDFQSTNYEWFWLQDNDLDGNYSHTVTYEVTVPAGASDGSYQIDAVGSAQGSESVDDDYQDTDALTITVESEEQNTAPSASFAVSQTDAEVGESVSFDASDSTDADGQITSYSWEFGDGETATGVSPTHAYDSAGTYTVELTVTDDDGATDTTTGTVTVSEPSTSSVTVSQTAQSATTVAPGGTVTVDVTVETTDAGATAIELENVPASWTVQATDSDGGDFQSTNYEWFWLQDNDLDGDYTHTVTYEVTVPAGASDGSYQIDAVGSAQGSESVDDDYSDTDPITITVQEPQNAAPSAAFGFSPSTPDTGESVSFDATSSGDSDGNIQSYSWEFGDGETASGATPSHTYDTAGTYTVELTVTDDDGATDTTTQQVTVSEPPAASPGAAEIQITPNTGTEASSYNNGAWQIANTGDQQIASVTFDLSTGAMPDVVFDPEGTAGDQAAKGLEIDSQSGDGVGVVSTADGDVFSQPHNGVDGDDGYDVMTVGFDDFEAGEEFVFSTDNDPTSIKGATLLSQESGPISGLEMARGTVTVTYEDGSTQTTQLFGDGSAGGVQATLDETVSSAPSIGVEGVNLDDGALRDHHSAATVGSADQTVTVTGQAGETVTLLHYEAELELSNVPDYDGTPGYDIEAYEANKIEQVDYQTVTLDANGEASVDVTLLNSTDVGGYNYFVAVHGQPGGDTGMNSDTVVLKYDESAEPANEPPSALFIESDSHPTVGESVTFDASASMDPDGSIASYEWTIEATGPQGESTLLESDFEDSSLSAEGWTHDAIGSDASAGVSDATSNSGSQSAFHNGDAGAIVSPSLDTAEAPSITVEYWVQKGAETFSENPDAGAGEDLVVEYLDANGDWVEIDRIEDTVEPGAEFTEALTLSDADALHGDFQLRFRQQDGSAAIGDFWHVDDVAVTAQPDATDPVTYTGEIVTHSFDQPGEYDVTLTVTDDDGATDSTTQMIMVEQADQPLSVLEAVASLSDDGDNSLIEGSEIQQAINWWATDSEVPDTGGETISDADIQSLINLWATDATVDDGDDSDGAGST